MTPILSIIIPQYKTLELIRLCIRAIKQFSILHPEIIVVDNNSIDHTLQIINEFPFNKKITYFLIENFGVIGKSRNLGITQAKGKYIAFLDSDDWWHENKLQLAFEYLENGKRKKI